MQILRELISASTKFYLHLDTVWRHTYPTVILLFDNLAKHWIIIEWFEHGNIHRVLGYGGWILAGLVPRYIKFALRQYLHLNIFRTTG